MALSSVMEGVKLHLGPGSCILKRPLRSRQTLCSGPRSLMKGAERSMAQADSVSSAYESSCQEETSRDMSQIDLSHVQER